MWYVIQVESGKEEKMRPYLDRALSQVEKTALFIPKYVCMKKYQGVWHREGKVLFPGYIFADTENAGKVVEALKVFSSGVRPVCIGGGFYPIREEEQEFLSGMMDAENEIGLSVGNLVNGELIVEQGPLKSRTKQVVRIDRHQRLAELRISLWGEERRMRVGLEVRQKIGFTKESENQLLV